MPTALPVLGCPPQVAREEYEAVVNCEPGAVERVLKLVSGAAEGGGGGLWAGATLLAAQQLTGQLAQGPRSGAAKCARL